jgi:septal ring factor EnvC (AmiA/AmiB activator)
MSKHLTDDDIDLAVKILTGWNDKITWEAFLEVFSTARGDSITKAAIQKRHSRIVDNFNDAKKRARTNRDTRRIEDKVTRHGDVALAYQIEQNTKLKARIEVLERENRDLLEQFVRWLYNAGSKGVTPEILNRPLPEKMTRKGAKTVNDRAIANASA